MNKYWYYGDLEDFATRAEDIKGEFDFMRDLLDEGDLSEEELLLMKEISSSLGEILLKADRLLKAGEQRNLARCREIVRGKTV